MRAFHSKTCRIVAGSLCLAFTVAAGGCGTILNGTRQTVGIQSTPAGATVTTAPAGETSTTPGSIILERKNNYILTFTADGYEPAEAHLRREMKTVILVLDILAGVVGVIVDAVTGGWYQLEPETVSATLRSNSGLEDITVHLSVLDSDDQRTVGFEATRPGVTVTVEKLSE